MIDTRFLTVNIIAPTGLELGVSVRWYKGFVPWTPAEYPALPSPPAIPPSLNIALYALLFGVSIIVKVPALVTT